MRPRILITIGDYNGIGPETVLKTLKNKAITRKYDLTVISPIEVLAYYSKLLKYKITADEFNVIPLEIGKLKIKLGAISPEAGFTAGLAIKTAIELCLNDEFDAIVTAPINKKSLNLGGFKFDGHTEMLTKLSGSNDSCMVMLSDVLNMAFVTTHPPLKDAAGLITKKRLAGKINICYDVLKNDLAIRKSEMAVLGLNPHAGDDGLIGDEEVKVIFPVIREANRKFRGIKITGPYSPDAFFASKKYLNFEMTLAMYHDQGFIPFKMLAGHKGTNFTAGLPFVRTSPDHGTAFDIAGKGTASEVSLIEAIKWADKLSRNRQKQK
ncbi:MAG TPA: 4-hydroxythreonine-4-phosphate dehydrogenase PdxA [Ignavibacteria bacterium]|nr:4-hydroxythreonine-4-phosphate dehydrogenase PdxA [Ignavibacteria bacterium]HMR00236.1 4-hydroxythreonine-4-phosphate dehydrogenase PdxA [Ignavibacteria bacterium]